MASNPRRAQGGVFAGITPLDSSLLNFISHHGIEKVSKIITNLGDCTKYETREAFGKMVSDFNSKPLILDVYEDEDQGQDPEDGHQDQDPEDEHQDRDLEDEDEDEGEEDEDEDEADGKACKLFGDTKRAGLVKRLHAPIGDELEPKKPRIEESSCVHGYRTEAAGIRDSSLQA